MMRIRIIITLLIALFVESRQEAFGQTVDTLSLSDKVIRTASFATGFRGEVWRNPALYYYYTPYTWTRLDVNGAYHDKGKASLKQEGDKDTHIGVDVHSFVILSGRDRVFGSAGYRSEKQENVLWNENIDWKLISPYVTGVWERIVWEFLQISGFISRKVRFRSLRIKALLQYTICWDWVWIMCVLPEIRPERSIKVPSGEEV